MPYTEEHAITTRHECSHVACLYVRGLGCIIGPVTRVASGLYCGKSNLKMYDLPLGRGPAMNAFDLAVSALVPLAETGDDAACAKDREVAEVCAAIAYELRPSHERAMDPLDWMNLWTDRAWREARKTLVDRRYAQLLFTLEATLDRSPTIPNPVAILERADKDYIRPLPDPW